MKLLCLFAYLYIFAHLLPSAFDFHKTRSLGSLSGFRWKGNLVHGKRLLHVCGQQVRRPVHGQGLGIVGGLWHGEQGAWGMREEGRGQEWIQTSDVPPCCSLHGRESFFSSLINFPYFQHPTYRPVKSQRSPECPLNKVPLTLGCTVLA